jgi:hypothetical protein
MKLRIQGNSLRLRLSQSEVAQFSKTGFVEDSIQFGGASLSYTIETASALPAPLATFQDHWLRVQVPSQAAQDWYTSDRVAISSDQPIEGEKTLSVLIEKDFQCLHAGGEQRDPDAYPNPLEETAPRT